MDSEPTNLYLITTRELHVFTAIAGLWLKTRKPPAVRETYRILRECGILGSIDALNMSIRKLIKARWLEPRPYGEKLHRYVPTLWGFAEAERFFLDFKKKKWEEEFDFEKDELYEYYLHQECVGEHVDVKAVRTLRVAIKTIIDAYEEYGEELLPPRLREVARAALNASPIDAVSSESLEMLLHELEMLQCALSYLKLLDVRELIRSELGYDACEKGTAPEVDDIVKTIITAELKLIQFCERRTGTPPADSKILKSLLELDSLICLPARQANTTNS